MTDFKEQVNRILSVQPLARDKEEKQVNIISVNTDTMALVANNEEIRVYASLPYELNLNNAKVESSKYVESGSVFFIGCCSNLIGAVYIEPLGECYA